MTGGTWRLTDGVRPLARGLQGGSVPVSDGGVQSLAFGTAPGGFTEGCKFAVVVDPGQTVTLNLYDGSLPNLESRPAYFAKLRSFRARVADGGDSAGVAVTPAAANGNTLWWRGTNPGKTIYPNGPAELGGNDTGVAVTSAAAAIALTNLGAVAATVQVALAGLRPDGVTYFPGSNLLNFIG